ncbi:MAG: hypothetical protein HOV80_28480 [Polyangiaceae bacterium]|nr:hypothetical protein [Polyangiaceae bacterium]
MQVVPGGGADGDGGDGGDGGNGGSGASSTGGSGGGTCVPGKEICDGKDNDCDKQVDEPQDIPGGCACSAGQTQSCYSGAPSTQGVGQCIGGVQTCVGNSWGACQAEVTPQPEKCNGLDDDCNGAADDIPGVGELCNTGFPGVCADGIVGCIDDGIGCVPISSPTAEVCDGLDNDCNGLPDDGDPQGGGMCNTGLPGLCAGGTSHCFNGSLSCVPNQAAQTELCNGADDDCDGTIDDGNPGGGAACSTGQLGVCAAGTMTCSFGTFVCQQNVFPSQEICGNATDENCDGSAPAAPTVYFNETFADNSQGWTLGPTWAIGSATASACSNGTTGEDPGFDNTPTADNGIAGVVIGGCYPTSTHADFCLISPSINIASAPGTVLMTFFRHLHTDYPNFIGSHVDVSSNDGLVWTPLYAVQPGQFQNDTAWTQQTFDVTAQKSATFRMRFCYSGGQQGIFPGGGWNVDDVQLVDAVCN